jgi:hypothetical protein
VLFVSENQSNAHRENPYSRNPFNEDVFSELLNENKNISATSTSNRQGLSAEKLASTWKIPLRQAQNTLRVTTQRGVRHIANPAISRRFRTNDRMLRYRGIPHTIFTDTLKSTVKSTRKLFSVLGDEFGEDKDKMV